MNPAPREGRPPRALLAAGSALPAALFTALADNALGGGDLNSYLHVLALILALSIPLTVAEALLGAMLPRESSMRGSVRRFAQLFQGEDGPARLYALATESILLFLAVRSSANWFIRTFHHPWLIALCITLVIVGLVGAVLVTFLPLVNGWRHLLLLAGSRSERSALLVMAAMVGGLVAWGVRGGILGEGWDIRPPLLLLLFLLLQVGGAFLLGVGNWRLPFLALVVWLLLAALLIPHTLLRLDRDTHANLIVTAHAGLAGEIAAVGRRWLDRDGDGYAKLLGGGDCNDQDPEVRPGAMDLPGNGRDEDCDGQDNQPSGTLSEVAGPDRGAAP